MLLKISIATAVLALAALMAGWWLLTIMLGLLAASALWRIGDKRKHLIHKRDSLTRQIELLKTRPGWMTARKYWAIQRQTVMLQAKLHAVEAELAATK